MTESDKLRADMEARDKKAWSNSEYSEKGSPFYISYAKWKRLSSRICRVKTTICLMGKMGEVEEVKFDSAHSGIGMSRKSLDDFIKEWGFVRKPFVMYWVSKWNIQAY